VEQECLPEMERSIMSVQNEVSSFRLFLRSDSSSMPKTIAPGLHPAIIDIYVQYFMAVTRTYPLDRI
jgi:hypothetical protein